MVHLRHSDRIRDWSQTYHPRRPYRLLFWPVVGLTAAVIVLAYFVAKHQFELQELRRIVE